MDLTLEQFNNNFQNYIIKIKEEYDFLTNSIKMVEEKNFNLTQENINLKNTIDELNKEKKAKSSSTLWESMNSKIIEKDNIIEQLKKDIEFYKRTGTKTNIGNKYQSNLLKLNSVDSGELVSIEQNDLITINDDTKKNDNDTKVNDNIKKQDNDTKVNILGVKDQNKIIIENHDTNLKKKDKSKDKSEKKKKKKIIDDDGDLDDLEKELAGIK